MFNKYISLAKDSQKEVEGILQGICHIFPKLDGTNGSIWYEDNELKTGSRNRELSRTSDNQGFCNYVLDNSDKYLPVFKENPGIILYGEWLVNHTVKYETNAYRKFYIFDVFSITEKRFLSYIEYVPILEKHSLEYIPCIETVENPTIEFIEQLVVNKKAAMLTTSGLGEGVVVKRYDFINCFGRTTWMKQIAKDFSAAPRACSVEDVEQEIVSNILKDSFLEKEKAKLEVAGVYHEERFIGSSFTVFMQEEIMIILKKLKNPIIDFARLKVLYRKRVIEFIQGEKKTDEDKG